jgi:hypothetical protein
MRVFLYTLCFILFARCAFSQPAIQYVSGTVVHGDTISISSTATNFGVKTTANPVVWDTVEDGSLNTSADIGTWSDTNALNLGTESRHSESSYCGTMNFAGTGGDGALGYFTGPNADIAEYYFVQYWFMLDENFDWGYAENGSLGANLANVKLFRMWNPSIDENFVIATIGTDNGSIIYTTEYVSSPGGGNYYGGAFTGTLELGEWHLFQFEFMESSVGGNDGIIRWWVDGSLFVEDTDIMTRESYSGFKRPFIVGFFDSHSDESTDRNDWYIDDAYIDKTWARVEMGNNSIYANCTHREIQIPTAWASDEITVTVNQGTFAEDATAYLFVVDADGSVSDGYAVTIGAAASSETLTAPTNLQAASGGGS